MKLVETLDDGINTIQDVDELCDNLQIKINAYMASRPRRPEHNTGFNYRGRRNQTPNPDWWDTSNAQPETDWTAFKFNIGANNYRVWQVPIDMSIRHAWDAFNTYRQYYE